MEQTAVRGAKGRWLTASVLGVGIASFLSDAGHEAATAAMRGRGAAVSGDLGR